MSATMSLLGLYQINSSLFGELDVPEGVDKDTLVNNMLAETAELEILYPNPLTMQAFIGIWSHKELPIWERLYSTTKLEYNPIDNYNRVEKWTEDEDTAHNTDSESTATSRTQSEGTSKQDSDGEIDNSTNHFTSAYNETDFTPTGMDNETQQTRNNTTQTDEGDVSTRAQSGLVSDEKGNRKLTREGTARGNVGVTTTQKMITEEREISEFNIYDYITDSFKNRFCLQIY